MYGIVYKIRVDVEKFEENLTQFCLCDVLRLISILIQELLHLTFRRVLPEAKQRKENNTKLNNLNILNMF